MEFQLLRLCPWSSEVEFSFGRVLFIISPWGYPGALRGARIVLGIPLCWISAPIPAMEHSLRLEGKSLKGNLSGGCSELSRTPDPGCRHTGWLWAPGAAQKLCGMFGSAGWFHHWELHGRAQAAQGSCPGPLGVSKDGVWDRGRCPFPPKPSQESP